MDVKKIKLRTNNNVSGIQRILQIFSRRGYDIASMEVKTVDGFKEITIEFPADFYIYKTVVGQLKKMVDLIDIQHDKIDYEHHMNIEMENLF